MTEINWGYNCLTTGVHHGHPEAIWNLPLGYATAIYGRIVLEELVTARIYNDAMQMVKYGNEPRMPEEWAERVEELAHKQFSTTLDSKFQELSEYYISSSWASDIQGISRRVREDKLNPNYAPLHGHDSINMLCRILGVSCSREASVDV